MNSLPWYNEHERRVWRFRAPLADVKTAQQNDVNNKVKNLLTFPPQGNIVLPSPEKGWTLDSLCYLALSNFSLGASSWLLLTIVLSHIVEEEHLILRL
jgi:hypothetical protein